MAVYVTDMTKTPVQMLLGLVNVSNDLGLKPEDVQIKPPVVIADAAPEEVLNDKGETVTITRNTSIQIDLLTDEVENEFVDFKYQRVDLGVLFSQIAPNFREVDIPLNDNGVPAVAADFFAEVQRKFGVAMTEADFAYELAGADQIRVTAKPENYAYIGEVVIDVVNSLVTRVAKTTLEGFEKPAAPAPEQPAEEPAA